MKRTAKSLEEMLGPIPEHIQMEVNLSFDISDRIDTLMKEKKIEGISTTRDESDRNENIRLVEEA